MTDPKFYLPDWKPVGDGETCRLMERDGAEEGDAIAAEFSRYPAPLGEQLASAALTAANAHAAANPDTFGA